MKLALVTDAWQPQVNGVVTTLLELVRWMRLQGHQVEVFEPGQFRTFACPGYPGIDLALAPRRRLSQRLQALAPDSVHIATEGPLGWAARAHCLRHGLAFTTAFHTKFPEMAHAALQVPVRWGYALLRRFHRPSAGVLVPTQGVLQMLQQRGFARLRAWTHGVDTGLFAYQAKAQTCAALGLVERPLMLFAGRVSYEKNIGAFLDLDLPGTKVVCGSGPLEARLRQRYPQVRWLGMLGQAELARVYGAADALVFPSRTDTFGLVMLEAMACGTPVAAYPVDGPREVVGQSQAGCLHTLLHEATRGALALPRHAARQRAMAFSWEQAAREFAGHLVSCQQPLPVSDPQAKGSRIQSHQCHKPEPQYQIDHQARHDSAI